jgi:hypothetical protein
VQVETADRAELNLSKGWVQGVALVMIFGFFVMGMLALRTYTDSMPLPEQVTGPDGEVVYTGDDVTAGQQIFLRRGLQQYGSVMGHGGYLGPDYTAEYLRNSAEHVQGALSDAGAQEPTEAAREMLRENRYDEETGELAFTAEQVSAFEDAREYYTDFFGTNSTEFGLLPDVITDPQEIQELTAFFSWTAWAAAAERPGHSYSYTNNWPPRAARRQHPDCRHPGLVGTVADRPAARPRRALRALRALEPHHRLARHRAAVPRVPSARGGSDHQGSAGDRVVLLRRGGAVPGPSTAGRCDRALPRRPEQLLRHRPRPGAAV